MKLCVCLATSKLARVIYSGPSGKVDHRCNVLSFTDSSPSSGPYRSTVPQLWSRRNYQWITRVVTLPRLCYIKKYESLCWSEMIATIAGLLLYLLTTQKKTFQTSFYWIVKISYCLYCYYNASVIKLDLMLLLLGCPP